MKRSRFSEEPIIGLLKEHEAGVPVAELCRKHGVSDASICRMTVRYQTTRAGDGVLRERMKAMAAERRRFGYRRLHVLLRREGFAVNHKRLFRIYREERLMVRRRGGRKRAIGTRAPILTPLKPNERWSLDFVSDQFTDGRHFRILTVVDDCTRECLGLLANMPVVANPPDDDGEGRGLPERQRCRARVPSSRQSLLRLIGPGRQRGARRR